MWTLQKPPHQRQGHGDYSGHLLVVPAQHPPSLILVSGMLTFLWETSLAPWWAGLSIKALSSPLAKRWACNWRSAYPTLSPGNLIFASVVLPHRGDPLVPAMQMQEPLWTRFFLRPECRIRYPSSWFGKPLQSICVTYKEENNSDQFKDIWSHPFQQHPWGMATKLLTVYFQDKEHSPPPKDNVNTRKFFREKRAQPPCNFLILPSMSLTLSLAPSQLVT